MFVPIAKEFALVLGAPYGMDRGNNNMSQRETIRDFSGMIVGYLDHESNGDIVARTFSGKTLGRYEASSGNTKDFYGRILYRGNMAPALLVLLK